MDDSRFTDRTDAGRALAERLVQYRAARPIVLALPRGGVPVAAEVAKALDAPLDVLVVRKLGAPGQPELAIGAVGPAGLRHLNEAVLRRSGASPEDVEEVTKRERAELQRRDTRYRGSRPFPDLRDRTVILVDDGIATGSTVLAALKVIKNMNPDRVVLATPVVPASAVNKLRAEVDDLTYVHAPEDFRSVGLWYEDFGQTSDDEVVALLERHGTRSGAHAGHTVARPRAQAIPREEVSLRVDDVTLQATLSVPPRATGLVIFAHGSGSGRSSPRNRYVAESLQRDQLGTLLLDLLTEEEEKRDRVTRDLRFDIDLLARRLHAAARWAREDPRLADLPRGYFGSSTGGGAALVADAMEPGLAKGVVSRGGRPDLAEDALAAVQAPTLLIVGGEDHAVIGMNQDAMGQMEGEVRLEIVPGATHLFEEPGKLAAVAGLAAGWFRRCFGRAMDRPPEARRG